MSDPTDERVNMKKIAGFSILFFLILLTFFPYASLIQYRLAPYSPALQYKSLRAAPWYGIRMTGIQVKTSTGRNLVADQIRIWPAGLFPPRFSVEMNQNGSTAKGQFWGTSATLIHFEGNVDNAREFISDKSGGLNLTLRAKISGHVDFTRFRILDGTRLTLDASGDLPGISAWASLLGNRLEEATFSFELIGDIIRMATVRMKGDAASFEGSAEIRPSYPLKNASMHLKGQAMVSGQAVPFVKSIPLAELLSPGGA